MYSIWYHHTCRIKILRIANTYDWIIATVASWINRRICAVISTVSNVCLIDSQLFPSSFNNKCPAIILAVRRTANVPGRIRLLIVSIITINFINIVGVPWGTKCSNMWLVFFIQPNNINLIHSGKATVSVTGCNAFQPVLSQPGQWKATYRFDDTRCCIIQF